MYEFSDKKVKEKFKKTEYGKKTNLWLLISGIIALIFIIIEILFCFIDTSGMSDSCFRIISSLFVMAVVTASYFDGKRDGAIEQFKKSNKK